MSAPEPDASNYDIFCVGSNYLFLLLAHNKKSTGPPIMVRSMCKEFPEEIMGCHFELNPLKIMYDITNLMIDSRMFICDYLIQLYL